MRFMQLSDLLREGSLCTGWRLMQRFPVGQSAEIKCQGLRIRKGGVYVTPPTPGLSDIKEEGVEML